MHSLVEEVTGINFASFGDDIEAAKNAAVSFFAGHIERHDTGTILKAPSIGHLVNEVIAAYLEHSHVALLSHSVVLALRNFKFLIEGSRM